MCKLNDKAEEKTTESDDTMAPAVKLIEKEREQYYTEIQEYILELRGKSKKELKKIAKKNLIQAGIIDKKGNLTDAYSNSRRDERD